MFFPPTKIGHTFSPPQRHCRPLSMMDQRTRRSAVRLLLLRRRKVGVAAQRMPTAFCWTLTIPTIVLLTSRRREALALMMPGNMRVPRTPSPTKDSSSGCADGRSNKIFLRRRRLLLSPWRACAMLLRIEGRGGRPLLPLILLVRLLLRKERGRGREGSPLPRKVW